MSPFRLRPEELAPVLDALREGLQVIDRQWRYAYVNDAAAAHGRRTRDELIGRTMMECYPGIDQTAMFARLRLAMEQHEFSSFENEFTYPDGSSGVFALRIEPYDKGVIILSIDMTAERRTEHQLRHAQKMEAVGRLAGSVAHDFNNMLSVILSYSELVLADLRPVDPIRSDIEEIRRAGEKAAALTTQLLAFSRQQVIAPRPVVLSEHVQATLAILRRLLGADVELITDLARAVPPVLIDPGQFDQVLMNLALNARDAMPDGGKLTIETRAVTLGDDYVATHFNVAPGPYVLLAVSDTGIGMDTQMQTRVFDPFFTTKDPGRGTGLGLATVLGIVQQHGGSIWLYSEPGVGSTFKVYLPVFGATDEAPEELLPPPTTLHGAETILLVEDLAEVRQVAVQILRRYGYNVLEAANAGEALLTCERHPRAIDLLVTDVVMPQMGGRELAERLQRLRPQLKVLYMSGYTDNAIVRHGILESGNAYLQKPILPESLARAVREVLDLPHGRRTPVRPLPRPL